jgi:hypothetical protein
LCFVASSFDLELDLRNHGTLISLDLLGSQERGFKPSGSNRGDEGTSDGIVNLAPTNPHAVFTSTVGDVVAWAVVGGRGELAGIRNEQLAAAACTARESLKQGRTFSHGAPWLVGPGPRVSLDPGLIGLEGLPIDETCVVVANENVPFRRRCVAHALPHIAIFIDEAFGARPAIDVGASINWVGQHLVNFGVGGRDPLNFSPSMLPRREEQSLRAKMQPYSPGRSHLGKACEHSLDCTTDSFVRIEKDLAVLVAEDQADGKATAQFSALGLVANSAIETSAQDM